jgi:hypothetical protein
MKAREHLGSGFRTNSLQKIRADHLRAVAPRLVTPQHQIRCFKRLLDYRQLALVGLERKNLPRLSSLPGQVFRDLSVEFFLGEFASTLQPCSTIKPPTIPLRDLSQFPCFAPVRLLQFHLVKERLQTRSA